jgi:sortase B
LNKGFKITINTALIGLLGFSTYKIGFKLYDYKKASSTYDSIEEVYNDKSSKKENPYTELKVLNPDYRFWIEIENTNVNYPVVQGTDNINYLTKDFHQKNSSSGTIFLDHRNNIKEDFNNLVYGHNMKNKTIFNNVENYKEEEFFRANNKITLTDDKYKYTYEVFSVYLADGNIDASTHTDINASMDTSKIKSYIDSLKTKSLHKTDIEVTPYDKILSLVTCSYESSDMRTIVHAKLINTEDFQT